MAKIRFTKDNRLFYLKFCVVTHYSSTKISSIHAYELKTNNEIGFLRFDYLCDEGYIQNIKITNEDYLNCGVGTAMIKAAETYLKKYNINKITGCYSPYGKGKEFAPYFYGKNGYIIDKRGLSKKI